MEPEIAKLLISGFVNCFTPHHILLMVLGVAGGIVIGTLPGLTATMAIALLVPVTFVMDPATGLVMLGAVWCGAIYGGAGAAILINVPGTPSSIATTFDGYPMTKKGDADKALTTSLIASVIGGIIGVIILLTLFAPLAKLSLKFGKPEYFWFCIFGLTTISAMSTGNVLKGLLGGLIGLLIGTIGVDPVAGVPRFTFGYNPLIQGVQLVPALIGFFAFSQMLTLMEKKEKYIARYKHRSNLLKSVLGEMLQKGRTVLLRSSIMGTFIGILPGAGGPVASIIAYNEAKRWDKNPKKYGKGAIEGIMASESANNAVIGGSLIPMMGLGIPGCPAAAVIMGGLLAHGIIPGSKLLTESADVAYTFITALIVANLIMLFVGYYLIKITGNILNVPLHFVVPIIIVLSVIGSYALRNSVLDIFIMVGCGVVAYILSKVGIDPGPLSLGLVLGPIAEDALGVSLVIAQAKGSVIQTMFLRPVSIILILLSVLSIFLPLIQEYFKKVKNRGLEAGNNDSTVC